MLFANFAFRPVFVAIPIATTRLVSRLDFACCRCHHHLGWRVRVLFCVDWLDVNRANGWLHKRAEKGNGSTDRRVRSFPSPP